MATQLLELPDELILSILTWLPLSGLVNCCRVSRSIYRLATDPSLWQGRFVEVKQGEGVPSPRLWCSSTVQKGKLYLYGGHTTQGLSNIISNVKSDLFEYDFATQKWTELQHQLGGKTEHKCVLYDGCLWFIGGYNGYDYTNDIFQYNPETKTSCLIEATGERFSPRSALTVVVWRDKLYTFGGWNGFSKTWYNDVHKFDFATKVWAKVSAKGTPPPQRTSHTAVVWRDKMYTFGGFSGEHYLNDLHEFDLETETWKDISHQTCGERPEPRSRFCAAVYEDTMYILGGWNKVGYFADLYSYNFVTKVWSNLSKSSMTQFLVPSISQYSIAIHDQFLYVFGGFCSRKQECINTLYCFKLPSSKDAMQIEEKEILPAMVNTIDMPMNEASQ
jgi:N-acetylneuraminic acid mutarotase